MNVHGDYGERKEGLSFTGGGDLGYELNQLAAKRHLLLPVRC